KIQEKLLAVYRRRVENAWAGRGERLKLEKGEFHLNLNGCEEVADLTPLQGMPLNALTLESCARIRDLTPLRGMPLGRLRLDISLRQLRLIGCPNVRNLEPLKGQELEVLNFNPRDITRGIEVVRNMTSLKQIVVNAGWGKEQRYSTAEFWKKYTKGEFAR